MSKPLHRRIPLLPGSHRTREQGMCALEMVAWLAGLPHSDQPECTDQVLGALVRTFNDLVPDTAARNRWVRPLVPKLVNTTAEPTVTQRRAFVALDAAVREFAPRVLAARGDHDGAERLRRLDEVTDAASAARAAVELEHFGRAVHAAWWTASRAALGVPAHVWITGVAHAAKAASAWPELQRTITAMVRLEGPSDAVVPSSAVTLLHAAATPRSLTASP